MFEDLHTALDEALAWVVTAQGHFDEATGPWVDLWADEVRAAELHRDALVRMAHLIAEEERHGSLDPR